jgi:hypothetical protein
MRDDSWTGAKGVDSRDQWLANKTAQNEAMLAYTRMHYKSLVRLGVLTPTSSIPRIVGMLAASHLMGVGGAKKLANGAVASDAFGTSTASYYALLAQAFGGSSHLQA